MELMGENAPMPEPTSVALKKANSCHRMTVLSETCGLFIEFACLDIQVCDKCVPGTVLQPGHIAENTTDTSPWSFLAHILLASNN